ncbi:MAG: YCF48-related protein [Arenimonas sp.]
MSNSHSSSKRYLLTFLLAMTLPLFAQTAGQTSTDSAELPAEMKALAADALLLDIARTNSGYFAVGERGHVLASTDGKSWTQVANVPTRSTLTSIAAIDENLWAAGHDGIILASTDSGKTWMRQRIDIYVAGSDNPAQGAPILDLLFIDAKHGFAIGAYSLMLETLDGGTTWTPRKINTTVVAPKAAPVASESGTFTEADLALGDEADPHFNAMTQLTDGTLVLVGERGTVYRSSDKGATWSKLAFPYKGSMFGVMSWNDNNILAYGLRGNIFESTDRGDSWNKLQSGSNASLMGGIDLLNGGAVLVGANGVVLRRNDAASAFAVSIVQTKSGEEPVFAAAASSSDGQLVLVGDKGAELITANTETP